MKQKARRSLKSRALQLLAQREQSRVELRRKLITFARADDAARIRSTAGEAATLRMRCGKAGAERPPATSLAGALDTALAASGLRTSIGADDTGEARVSGTDAADATDDAIDAVTNAADAANGADAANAAEAADRVGEVLDWLDSHRLLSDERFTESRINARADRYGDLRIRQELKQHGVALGADAARRLSESEASRAWAVWERRFRVPPETPTELARQARFLTARGFSPDSVRQVLRRARALRIEPKKTIGED